MTHLEAVEAGGTAAGFFPERAKRRAGDFVSAAHLADHEFRVGDYAEAADAVFGGPGENGEETLVFGVVIGLAAEILAETGDDAALRILDDRAVGCGAGITAGAAIAVGGEGARFSGSDGA